MAPKIALMAVALVAMALSGCTAGSDGEGDGSSTSTSGGVGVGGTVTGPGGGVGGNATLSGSASATSTNTSEPGANMTEEVSIEGGQYVPSSVTIMVGGTVTWTHNDGTEQHTVTADDGSFDSNPNCNPPVLPLSDCLSQGEKFSATFTTVGDYAYHCKVHSGMSGTVRVVDEP